MRTIGESLRVTARSVAARWFLSQGRRGEGRDGPRRKRKRRRGEDHIPTNEYEIRTTMRM